MDFKTIQNFHYKLDFKSNITVIGGNSYRGQPELCEILDVFARHPDLRHTLGKLRGKFYVVKLNDLLHYEEGWTKYSLEHVCGSLKKHFIVLEEADNYLTRELADLIIGNTDSQFLVFSRAHWFDNAPSASFGEFVSEYDGDMENVRIVYKEDKGV